jgi:hypothetical protein
MQNLIKKPLILLTLLLFMGNFAQALDRDKKLHFGAAGSISAATYIMMRHNGENRWTSYIAGFTAGVLVGVVKELSDDPWDSEDMEYNALGAATVPLIVIWY